MQRAVPNGSDGSNAENASANQARSPHMVAVFAGVWNRLRLPTKLLILTLAFVLMAEGLIFLPSIANYRVTWLQERLTTAQLASLASESYPGGQVPSALRADLLRTAQVRAIASRREGRRQLVLPVDSDVVIDDVYHFRHEPETFLGRLGVRAEQIRDAVAVMFSRPGRTILVTGFPNTESPDLIEIVLPEAPLKTAMLRYAENIFWLSIILSALTASVVYFALSRMFVKPLSRLTSNMLRFAGDPEDASRIMPVTGRKDEIGITERELARMQTQLSGLLAQKNRLAQLGLAVSKINHDLRNLLANTQLISDRLVDIPDPTVQRFVPKLMASLDRAIEFCNSTLKFGAAAEAAPRRELILLKPLVEEVADSQGLAREGSIKFFDEIDCMLRVDADRDQLFRIMSNLIRNAMQALEGAEAKTDGEIRVAARREGRKVIIGVEDNGPGVPAKARETLFKAFQASTKKGGTGLGLSIAAELVQAHGGSLTLANGTPGAHFRIVLPDRNVY